MQKSQMGRVNITLQCLQIIAFTQGDTDGNVRRAAELADYLCRKGYAPICPHTMFSKSSLRYEQIMEVCVALAESAQVVYRIPGYSPGADREVEAARAAGALIVGVNSVGEEEIKGDG